MKRKTFYVIDPEAGFQRWDVVRNTLNINNAIIDNLCAGVVRQATAAFPMQLLEPSSPASFSVGISLGAGVHNIVCSMPIAKLPLETIFATGDDGVLHPQFDKSGIMFKMSWIVPSSMSLVLAAHLSFKGDSTQYLVAFDKQKRAYRLPVSNLYADCRLCPGKFNTLLGVGDLLSRLKPIWNQFQNSQWNADLFGDSSPARRQNSIKMFRFKPEGEGFTQMSMDGEWTTLCEKVGNPFIETMVIPRSL